MCICNFDQFSCMKNSRTHDTRKKKIVSPCYVADVSGGIGKRLTYEAETLSIQMKTNFLSHELFYRLLFSVFND